MASIKRCRIVDDYELISLFWHRTRKQFVPQIVEHVAGRLSCSRETAMSGLNSAMKRGIVSVERVAIGRENVSTYEATPAGRAIFDEGRQ